MVLMFWVCFIESLLLGFIDEGFLLNGDFPLSLGLLFGLLLFRGLVGG